MKQLLFIGLSMLTALQVAAQPSSADSLISVLETRQLSSNEKLALYLELCNVYEGNDSKNHMIWAEKGLALAEKEKNRKMVLVFTVAKIYAHIMMSDYDNAILYCGKGIELAKKENDKDEEAKLYMNLGVIYARKDDFITGMEYLWKALSIAEQSENRKWYSTILGNIGGFYRSMMNTERAIYYLEQARTIAEDIDFSFGLITIYYDLGSIFRDQKELDKALDYQLKALHLSRVLPDRESEVFVNQALSLVYMDLKDFDRAEESANECLRLAREFNDPRSILGAWNVLSNIYLAQQRYQECELAALNAWNIDSANLDLGRNITFNIAKSNLFMGSNKEKIGFYFDKYDEIMKMFTEERFQETMNDMEVKYETEKKNMQIASLEKERRLYFWIGIAGVLLALALSFVLLQMIRIRRKERRLIASEALREGEIGERVRIAEDLHDRLGGSLSAVKIGLKNAESLQIISDKIDACMKEVREITNNVMPRSLRLFGMKGALEDFCTQFSNLQFHFFGDDARIKDNLEYTLYCCARELVNNAQKHAGASTVNLQLVQSRRHVSLTVQDDGCGFDERTVVRGDGLQNIRNRIASCRGRMDIVSAPGKGTETVIEINIER